MSPSSPQPTEVSVRVADVLPPANRSKLHDFGYLLSRAELMDEALRKIGPCEVVGSNLDLVLPKQEGLDPKIVNRLANKMRSGRYIGEPRVKLTVDEEGSFLIQNGHHTFAAAMRTGTPILWSVTAGVEPQPVDFQNWQQTTWGGTAKFRGEMTVDPI